ncbi:uncharacterized protein L203_102879 [Cryptococcus depauperatus CBS 7841]|uniref:Uncharacterized protein n=1 Tax=Cryptococcus depauperatus CBS 7841 TaxID=1295531 RepID=A0A1E3IB00_9TREE|nr:hypothetical protein L203_04683 [Cryptococcus depauperatus CBS 7841]
MASASGYNHHRFARAVLKKSRKWEPSLTVQLFANHWRFENSPVNFQYDGPMKPFLLAIRSQVIPASLIPFLYDIQPPISFVDGCLVVELQDYRRSPENRSRVVMRPAAETLAQTIDVMLERKGQNWDEGVALELESRIIAATSPPLYLGTSIMATRNATLALTLTTPAQPNLSAEGALRRPQQLESELTSSVEKFRKLILAGSRSGAGAAPFQPDWLVLRAKEQYESLLKRKERVGMLSQGAQGPDGERPGTSQGDIDKKRKGKKRPGEEDTDEKPKSKKKKKHANGEGEGGDDKRKSTSKKFIGEKKKKLDKKSA